MEISWKFKTEENIMKRVSICCSIHFRTGARNLSQRFGRMYQSGNCRFAGYLREDGGGAFEQYLSEDRGQD